MSTPGFVRLSASLGTEPHRRPRDGRRVPKPADVAGVRAHRSGRHVVAGQVEDLGIALLRPRCDIAQVRQIRVPAGGEHRRMRRLSSEECAPDSGPAPPGVVSGRSPTVVRQ